MPRFKSIIFHQYSPKIKLFFKKMQNFQALGAPPPNPRASGGWGLCPQTPNSLRRLGALPPDPTKQPRQLRISGYLPTTLCPLFIIIWVWEGFCFEQFSLIVQLQTL